jgi:hypothetical protein
MPFTRVKIAVVAPTPRASVSAAMTVKARARRRVRSAKRMSAAIDSSQSTMVVSRAYC